MPQGNTLWSVTTIDSNTAIAVGEAGTVIKTTDGGAHWNVQHYVGNTDQGLSGVSFSNSQSGVVVGSNGLILRTDDDGNTWSIIPSGTDYHLTDVDLVDSDVGYAVGFNVDAGSVYLRTLDGGLTWTSRYIYGSEYASAISFSDRNNGTVVGNIYSAYQCFIRRTTDAGQTWVQQPCQIGYALTGVSMIDSNTAVAVGWGGSILRTTDAGVNWNLFGTATTPYLFDVQFIGSRIGNIVGGDNSVNQQPSGATYFTSNGGNSWTGQPTSTKMLYNVKLSDTRFGFAVGYEGAILRTGDGGLTWETQSKGSTKNFAGVHFLNGSVGIAVGSWGLLERTVDGGSTWIDIPIGFNTVLWGIRVLDTLRAIATGGEYYGSGFNGLILVSNDGGSSWETQYSIPTGRLFGIDFASAIHGIVVGDSGVILRTIDSGTTWTRLSSGTNSLLFAVSLIDSQTSVAVGDNGTILRTTDAGKTWVKPSSPVTVSLRGLAFHDDVVVTVGDLGIILRSMDRGITWQLVTSSTDVYLRGISYSKDLTWIAVGYDGTIIHSTDDGLTWKAQRSGTHWPLYSIWLKGDTGTIVGYDGTILHTNTGGIVTTVERTPEGTQGPNQFVLKQNYPNPFNPSTVIRYQLSVASQVKLCIFNLLGQEIATLIDEHKPQGSYSVKWNAERFPSGMYFYRLTAGGFVETKKLVLLK